MITAWFVRTVVACIFVCGAAIAADRIAGWYRWPRRWIWVTAIAASLIAPVVASVAPGSMLTLGIDYSAPTQSVATRAEIPRGQTVGTLAVAPTSIAPRRAPAVWSTGSMAWLLTTTVLVALLFALGLRLGRLRSRAVAATIDGFAVRMTETFGPAVVGLRHPAILVPHWVTRLPSEERTLMLRHEREHIASGDHWVLMAAAIGVVAMPWNVALWWQYARLRFHVEGDCDARVLARGADPHTYGRSLLRAAQPHAMAMFAPVWGARGRDLERRIDAMTARAPKARLLGAFSMTLITAGLIAVASDAMQPDPSRAIVSAETPFGYVRVTGYTRERLPARVRLTSADGKLRLVSESVVLRTIGDSVIELITPALIRVEAAKYSLVAEAMELGTEVEVAGAPPRGIGEPSSASARGPAPMLNFMKVGAREPEQRDVQRRGDTPPARAANAAESFSSTVPHTARAVQVDTLVPRGTMLVSGVRDQSERVHITTTASVTLVAARSIHSQVPRPGGGWLLDVDVPVRLRVEPNAPYAVRFEAMHGGAELRAWAASHEGGRVSGRYDVAFAICGDRRFFGIGGAAREVQSVADCAR